MTATTDTKVPTVEQREAFAQAVRELAEATRKVLTLWGEHFEDDAYTPETGYPYAESLDEVDAKVWEWADGVSGDADVAAGRA